MRLFYAINARGASTQLQQLQKLTAMRSRGARLVPSENFHVTLRFIGESDRLGELALALSDAVRSIRPFELALDRFDCFERGSSSTAVCAVKGDLFELNALHESLEAALFDAGFARDSKPLKPHITLAREVTLSPADKEHLRCTPVDARFLVNSVSLYRSTREKGRMVYTPIHTEKL